MYGVFFFEFCGYCVDVGLCGMIGIGFVYVCGDIGDLCVVVLVDE